jgi:lipoprotein-anchoring transpeptidase ErfK/SrfK
MVFGRRPAVLAGAMAGLTALTVAASALAPARSTPVSPVAADRAPGLPASVRPAFVPGAPKPLPAGRRLWTWAPVRSPVPARRRPRSGAPVVALLGAVTPDGSANIVSVIERRQVSTGRTWVRVGLPVLPNGTSGWVPRSALGGYETAQTHLDVDLRRLRATLFRAGRPVFRAVVGVGMPQWPTPRGTFYIRDRLTRYASPAYGPLAFGTNARSPTLTDWPGGGFVGIHGTDRPDLLPGRVSHGCIRLRNSDILALARLMPVGTPLTVH